MDNLTNVADAIKEGGKPKVCTRHPKAVWYDDTICPACRAETEFMEITDNHEEVQSAAKDEN